MTSNKTSNMICFGQQFSFNKECFLTLLSLNFSHCQYIEMCALFEVICTGEKFVIECVGWRTGNNLSCFVIHSACPQPSANGQRKNANRWAKIFCFLLKSATNLLLIYFRVFCIPMYGWKSVLSLQKIDKQCKIFVEHLALACL